MPEDGKSTLYVYEADVKIALKRNNVILSAAKDLLFGLSLEQQIPRSSG